MKRRFFITLLTLCLSLFLLPLSPQAENQNEQQQPRAPKPRPERKPNVWEPKKKPPMSELGFEEMLTRFKQNSEEKICALKRNTERKNGSRRK